MSIAKLYASKWGGYLGTHRMKAKRILMVLIVALILFAKPEITPNTFFEELFDWLGYVLVIFACLGRTFASVFICGRKNQKLSTQGLFSMVRNPLYVFSFIGTIGMGLFSGYLTVLALLTVFFIFYYHAVVRSEENFLSKKFGDEYTEYKKRVPRWFPEQWKIELPEIIEVHPKLLLQTIRDAALLFLMFPIMEIIESLHETGVLPTFFSLY